MIKANVEKIGKHVEIDPSADIKAGSLEIGDYVKIMRGFKATVSNSLYIGKCSLIYPDVSITGRTVILGDYSCFRENVTIGGGQSTSCDSIVSIGRGCLICENVLINDANRVIIGDDVGIGKEVDIWAHTGFLNAIDGYPYDSKPVVIGDHVWIASRSSILPNVKIGSDVVIGNHSLVNKSLPSGCFAGGLPCKVIKENCYPKKMSEEEKFKIVEEICDKYEVIMRWKGFRREIKAFNDVIVFDQVVFNHQYMTVIGELDEYAEDFRDHLRRNGIKFYTGKPFKSITPEPFRKLEEIKSK